MHVYTGEDWGLCSSAEARRAGRYFAQKLSICLCILLNKNVIQPYGEHTLAVLPTGFGKIDLFILAPLIMDVLEQDIPHYSLVIVPLISLMSDARSSLDSFKWSF